MDGNIDIETDEVFASARKLLGRKPPKRKATQSQGKSQYDHLFDRYGQQFDIDPALLRAQVGQESSFRVNARSPKGAQGLSQFMPATARRFNVDVNDPESSIRGQAEYMRFLLDRFNGDVRLALAGYNAGEGAVDKHKGIPPYRETQDYVRRIMGNYRPTPQRPQIDVNTDPVFASARQMLAQNTPQIDVQTDPVFAQAREMLGQGATPPMAQDNPQAVLPGIVPTQQPTQPIGGAIQGQQPVQPVQGQMGGIPQTQQPLQEQIPTQQPAQDDVRRLLDPQGAVRQILEPTNPYGAIPPQGQVPVQPVQGQVPQEGVTGIVPLAMPQGFTPSPTLDVEGQQAQLDTNREGLTGNQIRYRLPNGEAVIAEVGTPNGDKVPITTRYESPFRPTLTYESGEVLTRVGEPVDGKARYTNTDGDFLSYDGKNPPTFEDKRTKKITLKDKSVLTRDDETSPKDGFARYTDEKGNAFWYDGEKFKGAQRRVQEKTGQVVQPQLTGQMQAPQGVTEGTDMAGTRTDAQVLDDGVIVDDQSYEAPIKIEYTTAAGNRAPQGVDPTVWAKEVISEELEINEGIPREATTAWLDAKGFRDLETGQNYTDNAGAWFEITRDEIESLRDFASQRADLLRSTEDSTETAREQIQGKEGTFEGDFQVAFLNDQVRLGVIERGDADARIAKIKQTYDEHDKQLGGWADFWTLLNQGRAVQNMITSGGRSSGSAGNKFDGYREQYLANHRAELIKKYGDLETAGREMARLNEKYKGWTFAASSFEGASRFLGYLAQLPALGLEGAAVLNEATHQIPAEDNPLWQGAQWWRKTIEAKYNKDFDEGWVAQFADGFGQVAAQTFLAPLTGGASIALPLLEGGIAQRKEAAKYGATTGQKQLAFGIGALAAAPEVLLHAKFFKGLLPGGVQKFYDDFAKGIFNRLSKGMSKEEATVTTRSMLAGFASKVPAGATLELTQEQSENFINTALAKLTYHPNATWESALLSPKEAVVIATLGGIGGSFEQITQSMTDGELLKAEDAVNDAIAKKIISVAQGNDIIDIANREYARRQRVDQPKQEFDVQGEIANKVTDSAVNQRAQLENEQAPPIPQPETALETAPVEPELKITDAEPIYKGDGSDLTPIEAEQDEKTVTNATKDFEPTNEIDETNITPETKKITDIVEETESVKDKSAGAEVEYTAVTEDSDLSGIETLLDRNKDINILRDKEPAEIAESNGKVVGALFTSYSPETFDFDVVVDKDARRQGIATKLIESGLNEFTAMQDVYPDIQMRLDVVNPVIKDLLTKRYGFTATETAPNRWELTRPSEDVAPDWKKVKGDAVRRAAQLNLNETNLPSTPVTDNDVSQALNSIAPVTFSDRSKEELHASSNGTSIKLPYNAGLDVVVHEIGHVIHDRLHKAKQFDDIKHSEDIGQSSTTYGASNGGEAFAENVKLYFLSPNTLKSLNPTVFTELDTHITQAEKSAVGKLLKGVDVSQVLPSSKTAPKPDKTPDTPKRVDFAVVKKKSEVVGAVKTESEVSTPEKGKDNSGDKLPTALTRNAHLVPLDEFAKRVGDKKTAETQHRQLIQDAIKRGEVIPKDVLADYPDLATDKSTPEKGKDNSAQKVTDSKPVAEKSAKKGKSVSPEASEKGGLDKDVDIRAVARDIEQRARRSESDRQSRKQGIMLMGSTVQPTDAELAFAKAVRDYIYKGNTAMDLLAKDFNIYIGKGKKRQIIKNIDDFERANPSHPKITQDEWQKLFQPYMDEAGKTIDHKIKNPPTEVIEAYEAISEAKDTEKSTPQTVIYNGKPHEVIERTTMSNGEPGYKLKDVETGKVRATKVNAKRVTEQSNRVKPLKPRLTRLEGAKDTAKNRGRVQALLGRINEYPETYVGFETISDGEASSVQGITKGHRASLVKHGAGVQFSFYSNAGIETNWFVEGDADVIIDAVESFIKKRTQGDILKSVVDPVVEGFDSQAFEKELDSIEPVREVIASQPLSVKERKLAIEREYYEAEGTGDKTYWIDLKDGYETNNGEYSIHEDTKTQARKRLNEVIRTPQQGKLLAPNGKVSNLQNERLWKTVRTKAFKDWFGDWQNDPENASKVVDPITKEPLVVYHGSPNTFEAFDPSRMGEQGTSEGQGMYFTDKKSIADGYKKDGKVYEVFLNLRKPLDIESKTISRKGLENVIRTLDPTGDEYLANYGDVSYEGYNNVVRDAVENEYEFSDTDVDLIGAIINSSGDFESVVDSVTKVTGNDGVVTKSPWGVDHIIHVAWKPNQIKSIENRGSFSESDEILKSVVDPPDKFFSQLETVIADKMPNKASAQQIMGTVRKNGVKQTELDWLGLEDWLGNRHVTKDEVLEFIRMNNPKIEEVVKGDKLEWTEQGLGQFRSTGGYQVTPLGSSAFIITDSNNNSIPNEAGTVEEAQAIADEHAEQNNQLSSETKFGQYTLPSGENYKEVLLTLPRDAGLDADGKRYLEVNTRFHDNKPLSPEELQWMQDYYPRYKQQREGGGQYKSPHFDEPNIAVHIRWDERTDSEGRKTLHVAEIQSDWAQKGRKGYTDEVKRVAKEKDIDVKEAEKLVPSDFGFQSRPKVDIKAELDSVIAERATAHSADRYHELAEQEEALTKEWNNLVPNTPFKESRDWGLLGLKTALRYAVENGFDAVSFDTGETSAERYDLSKHLSEMRVRKSGDLYVINAYDLQGNDAIQDEGFTKEKLSEAVGKDLADKIITDFEGNDEQREQIQKERTKAHADLSRIAKDVTDSNGVRYDKAYKKRQALNKKYDALKPPTETTYSGLDLKVGGEGMKGFYDKILVNSANKYLKKWGTKVEQGNTETTTPEIVAIKFGTTDQVVKRFDTKQEGEEWLFAQNDPQAYLSESWITGKPIHLIPLTDAMRQSVEQGQPLFQVASAEAQTEITDATFLDTHDLFPDITSKVNGDEIEVSPKGIELVRRVLNGIRGDVSQSFLGGFLEPGINSKIAKGIDDVATQAKENEWDDADVAGVVQLAKDIRGLDDSILYVFDEALPEERGHMASYRASGGKSLKTRISPEAMKAIQESELMKTALEGKFGRQYGNEKPEVQVEELIIKVLSGQSKDYGWNEAQAEQQADVWLDGFLEATPDADLSHFDKVGDYAKTITQNKTRNETGKGKDSSGVTDGQNPQSETSGESKRSKTTAEGSSTDPNVKERSLPETLKKAGLDADTQYYNQFTNEQGLAEANAKLKKMGLEKAVDYLLNVPMTTDKADAVMAFQVQAIVRDEAARIEADKTSTEHDLDIAKDLRQIGLDIAAHFAELHTKAGQFNQAAAMISQSIEGVMYRLEKLAQKIKRDTGRDVTDATRQDIESKGLMAEEALNENMRLKNEVRNLQKKLDALKSGKLKPKVQNRPAPRQQIKYAKQQLGDIDAQIAQIKKELAKNADVILKMVASPLLAPNGKPSNLSPHLHALVRTEEFKKWFGDWQNNPENASKVVDSNGEPLVVYHGTPDASFTEFKADQFFSPDAGYASRYTSSKSASSSFYSETGERAPGVYPVVLNISKPFDTRIPENAKLYNDLYYRKFGQGAPITERGLPDWVEARDLAEFLRDEIPSYGFDGMLIDEGGDAFGTRPLSYVPFNPNQIKSIFNEGSFDPTQDSILKKVSDPIEVQLANVGASLILDKPLHEIDRDQFNREMVKIFGDTIKPELATIFGKSFNRRQELLAEAREQTALARLKLEFPDSTDAELKTTLKERQAETKEKRTKGAMTKRLASAYEPSVAAQTQAVIDRVQEMAEDDVVEDLATRILTKELNLVDSKRSNRKNYLAAKKLVEEAKKSIAADNRIVQASIVGSEKRLKQMQNEEILQRHKVKNTQQELARAFRKLERNPLKHTIDTALQVAGEMRAVMASGDLSGAMRQGFIGNVMFTGASLKGTETLDSPWGTMLKKSWFETDYADHIAQVENHPDFALMIQSGIEFAGAGQSTLSLTKAEENIRTEWAKKIPLLGKEGNEKLGISTSGWLDLSERLYASFLDQQRAALADTIFTELRSQGHTFESNPRAYKSAAYLINIATGKGQLKQGGKLDGMLKAYGNAFFAPSYMVSRFQMLEMLATFGQLQHGHRTPPGMRMYAAKKAARFNLVLGLPFAALMALGLMAYDPDDPDFLKIRYGKKARFEFLGGLQPPLRFISRVMKRTVMYAAEDITGDKSWKPEHGRGWFSDITYSGGRFLRGKASPPVSFAVDWAIGKDYIGEPFEWKRGIASRLVPLAIRDVADATNEDGLGGALLTLPALLGAGVSYYEDKPEKGKQPISEKIKEKKERLSEINTRLKELRQELKTIDPNMTNLRDSRKAEGDALAKERKGLEEFLANPEIEDTASTLQSLRTKRTKAQTSLAGQGKEEQANTRKTITELDAQIKEAEKKQMQVLASERKRLFKLSRTAKTQAERESASEGVKKIDAKILRIVENQK